jgi:hypothetical protein
MHCRRGRMCRKIASRKWNVGYVYLHGLGVHVAWSLCKGGIICIASKYNSHISTSRLEH